MQFNSEGVAELLAEFNRVGLSVAQWAQENEFSYPLVVSVLARARKGKPAPRIGKSHRIAVALGLKTGEAFPPRNFKKALPKS